MSTEIQAAQDFRVKYTRGIHEDGGVREQSEVEMLDDGEQHPDVGLQEADENTQKKLPAVRRSSFRVFKVSLGVLYLLILAGITTRYILVTLEIQELKTKSEKNFVQLQNKTSDYLVNEEIQQLQTKYDDINKNCTQLQNKTSDTTANISQLQRDYDELSKNHSQLQEEVKKLKEKMEGTWCPYRWTRFGNRCYFKATVMKNWSDSRRDCEDKGADLVIINSAEEQKFIHENMRGESWIGLSYDYNQRTWKWKWVDGSSLTMTFWAPGKPEQSSGEYAVCCDSDGKWTQSQYYEYKTWICEK